MPSRIVREDILTSARVDELDPPAEVFYRRLLSKVDDHGLYDARPAILRASLFPLRIDRVREADCSRWMAACQKAGLIVLYQVDGRPYMQVLNTKWQTRSEPKYPLPTTVNNCAQLKTPVTLDVVVDVVESVVDTPPPAAVSGPKGRKTKLPAGFAISDAVRKWAVAGGHSRLDERLTHFVGYAEANGKTYANWDQAFMNAIRDDWAKLDGKPAPVVTHLPFDSVKARNGTETKRQRDIAYANQQFALDGDAVLREQRIALAMSASDRQ